MTTPKKTTPKAGDEQRYKLDPNTLAIVAALLMHRGAPQQAALENAKHIMEKVNELIGA